MTSFYTEQELRELGLKHCGKNVLLSRKASIYGAGRISIGNNTRIDDFCVLSGNITIGSNVHIAAFCGLFAGNAGIVLNDFSGLSSCCVIYAESDDYSGEAFSNPTFPMEFRKISGGTVILGKHSVLGTGSAVLPGVTVGEGASVGSMSLVTKSLEPWGIYVGVPCKRLKDRSKNLLELEKRYLESTTSQ